MTSKNLANEENIDGRDKESSKDSETQTVKDTLAISPKDANNIEVIEIEDNERDSEEDECERNSSRENKSSANNKTFREQDIQTDELLEKCNKCKEKETKILKLSNDLAKEKANRVVVESDLDVKKKRIKKALDEH